MTAAEWGRAQSGGSAPAEARRETGYFGLLEYGFAGSVLLLLSGALLAPLFNPLQEEGVAEWLRFIWYPVYALILVVAGVRARSFARLAPAALLLAPLLLMAFASSQWSISPEATVRRSVALLFTSLFGLWLAARYDWRQITGLVAGAFLVLALGSGAAVLIAPGWAIHQDLHPGAWKGLWLEKNTLGMMMAYGALAAGVAAKFNPQRRGLWLSAAALCAGLVVMSTSATSLIALFCAGVAYGVVSGLRRGGAFSVGTAWTVLVVAGLSLGVLAFAPDALWSALGREATLTGRTEIWDAVMRRIHERPLLGHGYGAFWEVKEGPAGVVRSEIDWGAPTAHNGWLEVLLGLGWLGLGLFGVHLIATVGGALAALWRGPQAYWALPFTGLLLLFSLSESTLLQQNDLSWALYVMTAAKLLQRGRTAVEPQARPARVVGRVPVRQASTAPAYAPYAAAQMPDTLSFGAAVLTLLIFSKTWIAVALGGEGGGAPAAFQLVYLVGYGVGAVFALQRLSDVILGLARTPALVVLVLLAGVSTLWSVAPGSTALSSAALAATTLAGVALAARLEWDDLAEVIATGFAVLVFASALAALAVPSIGIDPDFGTWRGVWFHKNALGGNMSAAVMIFCAASVFRPRRAWLWRAMAVIAFGLLLLSASTTALASCLLGLAVLVFVALVRRGAAVGVLMTYAFVLAMAVLAAVIIFAGDSVFALAGKDATLTGRTEVWRAALRQLAERPMLGFGYNALWETHDPALAWVREEAGWNVKSAHNGWLETWLALGLVGLVVWAWLFLGTWVRAVVAAYRHSGAYLAAPWLMVFTITGLTESETVRFNELSWVLFVAIAVKLARPGQDPMAAAGRVRDASASP